jgi:uncharacterized protein (DUF2062 family)
MIGHMNGPPARTISHIRLISSRQLSTRNHTGPLPALKIAHDRQPCVRHRSAADDLLEWAAAMPRSVLKRLLPHESVHARMHALRDRWYARAFAAHLADPRLWSLQRRGVTGAFGAGLAICFVPLPVHVPLATLTAIVWRLNVPAVIATTFLVNPLTMVPVYYAAYRVGALLLGVRPHRFGFRLSWDWLQHGLGPMWKPFLLGCLVCALFCGVFGWLALELLWRWRVLVRRYRTRRTAPVIS